MQVSNKQKLIYVGLAALVVFALFAGFRTPSALVDSALVARASLQISVEEEGRTRLADRYQVSAPVAGYLSRIALEPGDAVAQGQPLFSINPTPVNSLDARSRAQAEATVARAQSALAAAQTQVEAEQARLELADKELARIQRLVNGGHLPVDNLDRARAEARRARASVNSAHFSVDVSRHELENAQVTVGVGGGAQRDAPFTVTSPIKGVVLSRQRQSEGTVQAGEAVLTLGDLNNLEVEVDLLSPDAVRVQPGMRVELARWGGVDLLPGRVRRVDPAGFTRFSALGVEEQRVWVIVDIDAPREQWQFLGDAYRVEARFILWEGDNIVQIPAGALFRVGKEVRNGEEVRTGNAWACYVIEQGRAKRRIVSIGRRSGLQVEVTAGLAEGERVLLYPGQDIVDGSRVRLRK
ncbi:MAG: HlyD family efflux transporter periplasmic adaptor subunit [Cellvibrio sp.]|uniref:efflux RND transporter periplasmic adaptor subunit n=1 Tax=Cellvibrio sp. TaxID=1965322 RepID=UPI0027253A41|nr:HlyD family efflux transporter periplasmic adaptor subunit [Cellvibrio sp.]